MQRHRPAWFRIPSLIPRPSHLDYLYDLQIMDRKAARQHWRESICACWDHRCAFCDGVPIDQASLTLDHVKPRSRGGQTLTSNIVPACSRCNHSKASRDWREWYRLQAFYCPVREAEIAAWLSTGDRAVDQWWTIGHGALEACLASIDIRAERHQQAA